MDGLNLEVRSDTAALRGLRHALSAWLSANGVADAVIWNVLLASNEAAANAVLHGGGSHTFDVAADVDGDVCVTVSDHGRWLPEAYIDDERGRGLLMMRALAQNVSIERTSSGTSVSLHFAL